MNLTTKQHRNIANGINVYKTMLAVVFARGVYRFVKVDETGTYFSDRFKKKSTIVKPDLLKGNLMYRGG